MSKKKKINKNKEKIVRSINNNIRSSVRKLNPILKDIVGKKVEVARRNLEFSEKRITKDIKKTIDSGFNKISSSYDLLASSFGYSKLQALIKVHLPILLPTISSATILLFVDIVKELPMTLILRPFNFNTLPVHLYELAEAENLSSIGVPGLILIIICLIPVIILSKGIINNVRH